MEAAFKGVPRDGADERIHRRQLADAINRILGGKLNAVAEITLSVSSSTTTFIDQRLTVESWLGFDPMTASAAAELGTLHARAADRNNAQWILTHTNSGQTDRIFKVLIVG